MQIRYGGFHDGDGDFPPHKHDTWEIVYQYSGSVTVVQNGVSFDMSPGMMIVHPEGAIHQDIYSAYYELIYLFVEGEVLSECDTILYDDADRSFGALFEVALREYLGKSPFRTEMLANLAAQLELLIRRQMASRTVPRHESHADPRLLAATQILRNSVTSPVSVDEVCDRIGVSRTWLYESFRAAHHCSPHEFLNRLRLERALALLRHSSLKIGFIAAECGYCSTSHLTNHVKRVTGHTPREIRAGASESLSR